MLYIGFILFFIAGYWYGRYKQKQSKPRHSHDWEVLDKKELTIPGIDKALVDRLYYSDQRMQMMPKTVPHTEIVVHYRCMCGAEKVERV